MSKLTERQLIIRAMPYIVLHVLLKHGALHEFIENIQNQSKRLSTFNTDYQKRNGIPRNKYISCAFIWKESKEGWQYWENIHDKVIESLT